MSTNFQTIKYRGHTIELVPKLGWSDAQQSFVDNGYQLHIDGPNCNVRQQTYVSDISLFKKQVDAAVDRSEVE